jgi:hypothetical protein
MPDVRQWADDKRRKLPDIVKDAVYGQLDRWLDEHDPVNRQGKVHH